MTSLSQRTNNELEDQTVQSEPSFWLRFGVYFTLGTLWAATIFGVIMLAVIIRAGSRHSYIGDQIDEASWSVLIGMVTAYAIIASFYLGIRGYRARFHVLLVMQIVLLAAFTIAVAVQGMTIFYF